MRPASRYVVKKPARDCTSLVRRTALVDSANGRSPVRGPARPRDGRRRVARRLRRAAPARGGSGRRRASQRRLRPRRPRRGAPPPGRRASGPRHPPRGARRGHRREPRQPGPLLLREPDDGGAALRGVPAGAGAEARRGGDDLRLPEARADPVPRGRPLERLPGGDERAVRPREENDARAVAGVPPAVRDEQRRRLPRQPLRAARQLRPRHVARDLRDDPQVRRGAREGAGGGRPLGRRHADEGVPLRRGRGRRNPPRGREGRLLRAGQPRPRRGDRDPRPRNPRGGGDAPWRPLRLGHDEAERSAAPPARRPPRQGEIPLPGEDQPRRGDPPHGRLVRDEPEGESASMKKALITGVTGQDGSYLAELLLAKGYEVYGVIRRSSSFNTERLDPIYQDPHAKDYRLRLVYGDLDDASSLNRILRDVRPDEVYNLGAQSHVRVSFDVPEYTASTVALGTLRLLEAIRETGVPVRFYQASSSEMFCAVPPPQDETTPFLPRSPYACAKVFAHQICQNYRDAYGIFICCGILFNHESPRRGVPFVTRKITRAAARIKHGLDAKLYLGNLDARRDWGFAGDYVEAMWLMLQQEKPDDYVVATGESHSVREVLDAAFGTLGLDWTAHVEVDPRYLRPTEVDHLRGDASKAERVLGWKPKVRFRELIEMMVKADEADVNAALSGRAPIS